MTVNVQLDTETVQALGALAQERGMSLDGYLRALVEELSSGGNGAVSVEEFDRGLDELAADLPDLPPLPAEFSRADIYAEHD